MFLLSYCHPFSPSILLDKQYGGESNSVVRRKLPYRSGSRSLPSTTYTNKKAPFNTLPAKPSRGQPHGMKRNGHETNTADRTRRGVLKNEEVKMMIQNFQTQATISSLRQELEESQQSMHRSEEVLRHLMPHFPV